jgi:uncharacterized protein
VTLGIIAPVPDADAAPWWEALARHELMVQACDPCGHLRWPARAICGRCGSLDWHWQQVSGRARVASWVVNRHPFVPGFETPYVVVAARLDEQDNLFVPGGYTGDGDGTGLSIGLDVVATFEDVVDEDGQAFSRIVWRPV